LISYKRSNLSSCEKYPIGNFAVLNTDKTTLSTAYLMDGGVEQRYRESYHFQNNARSGYSGYVFQYTLSGTGCFEKNGQCYSVEEGKGFWISLPEDSAYYLPKACNAPWTFLYLHFGGELIAPFATRLEEMTGGFFSLEPTSQCIRLALQLHQRLFPGNKLQSYESTEFTYQFLCTLLRDLELVDSTPPNSLASKGKKILEEEYPYITGIDTLAERLGVSQEHFCRIFKSEMNITPGQYLNQLRIQAAMYELLNTNDRIEIIARRTGFSTANYFCKVFRRHVGASPIQYRNMK